jgi:hypothetical protein
VRVDPLSLINRRRSNNHAGNSVVAPALNVLGRSILRGAPAFCTKRHLLFGGKSTLGLMRSVLPVVRVIASIRGRATHFPGLLVHSAMNIS